MAIQIMQFCKTDILGVIRSTECKGVVQGMAIQLDGIFFALIKHLVKNVELEAALGLQEQDFNFVPNNAEGFCNSLMLGMIQELGGNYQNHNPDHTRILILIPLTAQNGSNNAGWKTFIIKLIERVFLIKKLSTIKATIMVSIYDIVKNPGQLLGYLDLRKFYTLFHTSRPNHGGLRDLKLLKAYVLTRGLAGLHATPWRIKTMEEFNLYNWTKVGGWIMYRLACKIGLCMVKWLSWVAKRGFLPMHANLGTPFDMAFCWPMLEKFLQEIGQEAREIPTIMHSGNHHFLPRLPMPPRIFV